jgi:hypothetical protein
MRSFALLLFLSMTQTQAAPVSVTLNVKTGMSRGGKPYFVKGAGGETHLDELAARGANSLRTWSTRRLSETLETAVKLGLTVSAGIWLEPECSWFSYRNPEHCAKQRERVKQEVLPYRDHPALLAWGLGNEAEGDGTNAAYWQQLEQLALMVHELDPAHPTFTAVAGLSAEKAKGLNEHAPHLDYIGINTYGGIFGLRETLPKIGWTRPWMLTEWGPRGFWEQPKHKSGAPLEQTSTGKAASIRRGYDEVIAQVPGCLGSYAFVWGWKFEATATWFGLLTNEGLATPSVDVLQEKWSGKAPANRAPEIEPMRGVPKEAVKPGGSFTAEVVARDPEGDALVWEWSVFKEKTTHNAAERLKMPATLKGAVISTSKNQAVIQAPTKSGVYRLHVWVKDGQGHAATANLPFEVEKIVSP